MSVVIITGSAGLVGSESASYFAGLGMKVIGIDNDMRSRFFGEDASTAWVRTRLEREISAYTHYAADIRDESEIFKIFKRYGKDISLVIHTAAQPSHDWAASNPIMDFTVNANGTSVMLEATRQFARDAVFLFTSTNKVYGDLPNKLPLVELETRWEIDSKHPYYNHGIPETMSIDGCLHSLFGASKVAADVLVQEYGRYFGMKTTCFRGGCLTGPNHSGTKLHGFLAYLMKCAVTGTPYTVFGYKGKQVRDNIHSVDLIQAFHQVFQSPKAGAVYNIGGGLHSNCSMVEAITICEEITGRKFNWTYAEDNRIGDHIWWVSDLSRFKSDYPEWKQVHNIRSILTEIYAMTRARETAGTLVPSIA